MKSLQKYIHGERPVWALVTGASDGIGFGFVEELSANGFNVILHGRNENKLKSRISTLQSQYPERSYKIFLHDAEKALTPDILSGLEKSLRGIYLTALINNVGGEGTVRPNWEPFVARSLEDIDKYINLNVRFSTQLTRALLPKLIENQPGLVLNMSSFAAIYPSSYVSVLAGSKAFNSHWSASLKVEMVAEGNDVDVIAVLLSKAQSMVEKVDTNIFVPSSREMAAAALDWANCGQWSVTPIWGHWFQQCFLDLFPKWGQEKILILAVKGLRAGLAKAKVQ